MKASSAMRARRLGGIVIVTGLVAGSLLLGAPGAARPKQGNLGSAVETALEQDGPILTEDERDLVRRKCGYGTRDWDGSRFDAQEGVLICSNGRQVDDPEVRAVMARVGVRVRTRVRAAMERPEVRAAMSGEVRQRVRERMRRFDGEHRARIEKAVAEARAKVAGLDVAAVRARAMAGAAHAREVEGRLADIDFDRIEADLERVTEDLDPIGDGEVPGGE